MASCGIKKKFIAELIGTMLLVLFGTGSAVVTLLINDSITPGAAGIGILGGLGDWIAIAFAFGLTVMACIYLFGKISGAHLNPAVTIGLLVTKNISVVDSVYYIVAQVIGATLGSIFLFLCLGDPSVTIGGLGATAPGLGVSYLQAMFAEFLGTFFLMMVVMGVAVDKKADPATNPKAHRPRKRKGNVVDDKGNAETDIEDIGEPGTGEYDMTHPEGHNKGKGGEIHGGDAEDKYDPNTGEKIVIARRRIQALEARIPAIEPSEGLFDLIFNPTKTGTDVYIELLKSGIDGETEETIINSALLDGKSLEIINNKIHLDKIEKNQQYRIHLNLAETTNFIWEVNIDAED